MTHPASPVGTVVLVGEFARDRAFAHFLATSYPSVLVVIAAPKDRTQGADVASRA